MDSPAHVRTMAKNGLECPAIMHSMSFVVAVLDVLEQSASSQTFVSQATVSMRNEPAVMSLLTVPIPATRLLTAISGLVACIGSLSGLPYIDSISPLDIKKSIARLYHDGTVCSKSRRRSARNVDLLDGHICGAVKDCKNCRRGLLCPVVLGDGREQSARPQSIPREPYAGAWEPWSFDI